MACLRCAESLERAATAVNHLLRLDPSLLGPGIDWAVAAQSMVETAGRIRGQHAEFKSALGVD